MAITPLSNTGKWLFQVTANRVLWKIRKTEDGLSLAHLQSLFPEISEPELQGALNLLENQEKIIRGSDGWYYSAEDERKDEYPMTITPTRPAIPKVDNKPKSIPAKLKEWFEQGGKEISINDLADLLKTNKNTLGKAITKVRDEYLSLGQRDTAERFNASILRHAAVVVQRVIEPTLEESAWLEEFRARIMAHRLPESAVHWQETLKQLDGVFAELGIADTHRSRAHLREIAEWLMAN